MPSTQKKHQKHKYLIDNNRNVSIFHLIVMKCGKRVKTSHKMKPTFFNNTARRTFNRYQTEQLLCPERQFQNGTTRVNQNEFFNEVNYHLNLS